MPALAQSGNFLWSYGSSLQPKCLSIIRSRPEPYPTRNPIRPTQISSFGKVGPVSNRPNRPEILGSIGPKCSAQSEWPLCWDGASMPCPPMDLGQRTVARAQAVPSPSVFSITAHAVSEQEWSTNRLMQSTSYVSQSTKKNCSLRTWFVRSKGCMQSKWWSNGWAHPTAWST